VSAQADRNLRPRQIKSGGGIALTSDPAAAAPSPQRQPRPDNRSSPGAVAPPTMAAEASSGNSWSSGWASRPAPHPSSHAHLWSRRAGLAMRRKRAGRWRSLLPLRRQPRERNGDDAITRPAGNGAIATPRLRSPARAPQRSRGH
jgi:hypothetical protein